MKKILVILLITTFTLIGCAEVDFHTKKESIINSEISTNDFNEKHMLDESSMENSLIDVSVSYIIDGDTFVVNDGEEEYSVRFLLIDTPEMNYQSENPPEPYAEKSTEYLSQFIEGKRIQLEIGEERYDKYDRTLAWVYADGYSVQEYLLENGLAKVSYVFEPNTKYVDIYRDIESEARNQEIGIWSIKGYADAEYGFNIEATLH